MTALVEGGQCGVTEAAPCTRQPPLQGGDVIPDFRLGHSRSAKPDYSSFSSGPKNGCGPSNCPIGT